MRPARFGKYLLIESISRGGMAEVYLGKRSSGDERPVAIKRILPLIAEDADFQTMFVDEARISACLDHVNIGKVFEFGQHDGEYFIAMEYVAGRDVRAIRSRLVQRKEHMPVAMALCICSQLCRALDHAHRKVNAEDVSMEIVHRDVSPPNVLVSFDGEVKLIDFGIAWAASRLTRTRAGKLKGKFAYMSPEQVEGTPLDRRSDIFSCGTMLFEMLTHRRPFRGDNEIAVMHSIRKGECPPPSTINSNVPLAVDRIVAKALAREREERYQWASELEADIEEFLDRIDLEFGPAQLADWMREAFQEEFAYENEKSESLAALRPEQCAEVLDVATLEEHHPAKEAVAAKPPTDTDADVPEHGPGALDAESDDTATEGDSASLAKGDVAQAGTDTDADRPSPPPGDTAETEPEDAPAKESTGDTDLTDRPPATAALSAPPRPPIDVPPPVLLAPPSELAVAPSPPQPTPTGPMAMPQELEEALDDLPGDPTQISNAPGHMQEPVDPTPLDLEPPPEAMRRSQPIYPEGDTIVGGSLEIAIGDSQGPREPSSAPRVAGPLAQNYGVSLEASGPQQVFNDTGPAPAMRLSPEPQATPTGPITRLSIRLRHVFAGMSSLQVILLAALATLLVVGLAAALIATIGSAGKGSGPAGSLLITTTEPAGCTVVVDGEPRGLLTPSASFKLHGLAVGSHLVALKCAGYETYSAKVTVKASDVTVVDAPLKRKKE